MYSVAVVLVVIHGVALQTSETHEPSLAPSELTTMNTTGSSSVIKLFVRTWPGYCSVHVCRKLQAKDSIPMWTIGSLRASIVDGIQPIKFFHEAMIFAVVVSFKIMKELFKFYITLYFL